jgi:hypothetical protein
VGRRNGGRSDNAFLIGRTAARVSRAAPGRDSTGLDRPRPSGHCTPDRAGSVVYRPASRPCSGDLGARGIRGGCAPCRCAAARATHDVEGTWHVGTATCCSVGTAPHGAIWVYRACVSLRPRRSTTIQGPGFYRLNSAPRPTPRPLMHRPESCPPFVATSHTPALHGAAAAPPSPQRRSFALATARRTPRWSLNTARRSSARCRANKTARGGPRSSRGRRAMGLDTFGIPSAADPCGAA